MPADGFNAFSSTYLLTRPIANECDTDSTNFRRNNVRHLFSIGPNSSDIIATFNVIPVSVTE